MYASAPAPLADREGVGTSAEVCTFLGNTELQSSPQFGHFLAVKEMFGGWQAFLLHYRHGISVSLFHNESLQPSDLLSP